MKNLTLLLMAVFSMALFSCGSDESSTSNAGLNMWNNDRPHNPWVFRSVLDRKPRMVTLALDDNMWVAYRADSCALYKVWKGGVNFDGPVYTTAHGPQPTSVGDAYILSENNSPWRLVRNGKEEVVRLKYKGHRFDGKGVLLMYELLLNDQLISITERPEYIEDKNGLPAFERVFTTGGVPEGIQVVLLTEVSSIASKNKVDTDGDWKVLDASTAEGGPTMHLKGKLLLNSNGTTRLQYNFVAKPTIADANKSSASSEEVDRPLGYRLIARSDCKACHNERVKTIGPAYVEVAQKYANTEENIKMLMGKVQNGGGGVWGEAVMTAHPDLSDPDARAMMEYIMDLDAREEKMTATAGSGKVKKDLPLNKGAEIEMDDLQPGVLLKFWQSGKSLSSLNDVDFEAKPKFESIVYDLAINDRDFDFAESNYAIEYSGYFLIPESNNILLRLASDDGARLYIDGNLIIDNDGLHGMDAIDGELALERGLHPFKLQYFQGGGGKGLQLSYRSFDSGEFATIPSEALGHHKVDQKVSPTVARLPQADLKLPGDRDPLDGVHPSFDLAQARPDDFTPKVGGMDFLSDGRLVVSTWDAAGSVYLLGGVQTGDPAQISYKLIAQGLAEPLGVKVVDNVIYVLQKQELTRLVDENGDDLIDRYETVSNQWLVSANFHEFAFGLVYKDGYFYATLATAIEPGGASTNPQIPDRGKVVKINKETGQTSFIAHGLRTPNGIGIGVDNEIFVADNQGDWLPASKIVHIREGAWYGSRSVDFEGTAGLTEALPVAWLPQNEIGNSPSQPTYLNVGPYKGQMIHGEVTHGGIKRVFVEKINGEYQGALFRFTQGLEAGVNRLVWGPDGALYIGGVGSTGNWGHAGKLQFGLQKLSYNESSAFEMLALRARSNGVEIELTEALREGEGWNSDDYEVKQWYYQPTANYGGPKLDERNLTVASVNISGDRKKIFLELKGMKEGHMVYVRLKTPFISANGHGLWTTECWYTMNQIPQNLPGFRSDQRVTLSDNTLTEREKAQGWQLLFDGKTTEGWRNFKSQDIGSGWVVKDGMLMLDAKAKPNGGWQAENGGDIITDEVFENYELELEWKIGQCGNSGLIFNVVEDEKYKHVWHTGPEMQILDNSCHPDAKIQTHQAGDLYDLIESKYTTVKPAGQWNRVRLIVNNGHLEQWLNGRKVVETEMWTDKWREMIANSKFKDMPDFGTAKKGHIALQDHGDLVMFKNIKIRRLDPTI